MNLESKKESSVRPKRNVRAPSRFPERENFDDSLLFNYLNNFYNE